MGVVVRSIDFSGFLSCQLLKGLGWICLHSAENLNKSIICGDSQVGLASLFPNDLLIFLSIMAAPLFFRSSRSAFKQVTELFDFVWPTATALWNLRWQVAGFVSVRSDATSEELAKRFTEGSGIHGANIKKACLEMNWDQQQSQFAKFLLTDLFAIYEG
jgi:hypothetical protein